MLIRLSAGIVLGDEDCHLLPIAGVREKLHDVPYSARLLSAIQEAS